jgi:hypothetical protein
MGSVALASAVLMDTLAINESARMILPALGCALTTAVVSGLAARRAVGRGGRTLTTLALGAAFGSAATVLFTLVLRPEVSSGAAEDGGHAALLLFGTTVVAIGGALLGALFGLAALPSIHTAARAERLPSLDGLERVFAPAAILLCPVGRFALLYQPGRRAPATAAFLAVALALLFVALRDVQRVLWLRAVGRGGVPGWAIVGAPPGEPERAEPRYAAYSPRALDGLLTQLGGPPGSGPFREPAGPRPVAALPRDPMRAVAPLLGRAVLSLVLLAAALAWFRSGLLAAALRR